MSGEVANREWEIAKPSDDLDNFGFAETDRTRFISNYRDLDVWKEGMALTAHIYRSTADFPREELYGLTSQMRRASVSVPSNIAEGYGRETTGAFIQFLRIAQGSLKELETLVELSSQLGFVTADTFNLLNPKIVQLSKMLRGLIRSLERRSRQ